MIPFVDLKAQYTAIRDEVNSAIQGVLDTCQFTLGSEVAAFEEEFADYCGAQFGVGVNSGTSALHLALLVADIGPGDEVITTPFTFVATVAAIHYTGAKTVFVDIDPRTLNIDPEKIEAAITPKTKVILPVHLHGLPAEMQPIMDIARKHGLLVIEDAAQAHGAEYSGQRVGGIGDMGCFSFYPGKNLGAYGEGGMVVTNNPDNLRKLRMLRDWGAEEKYRHVLKGYNYRMEGIQGAVLRVKMRHIEKWTEGRRAAAANYDQLLAGKDVITPYTAAELRHVYHIYAIRTGDRKRWQESLQAQEIQTGIHYPIPVHLLPAYSDLNYKTGNFPHAELAANEVLSLPMFAELSKDQCEVVAQAINELTRQDFTKVS